MDKSIATTKPEMWLLSPVFTAPPSAGFSFLLFVPFAFAVTFKAYSAVLSPTFAVIFTFPAFTALTTPFASTVATFVSELLHTTVLSSVVFVGLSSLIRFVVFHYSRQVISPLLSIHYCYIISKCFLKVCVCCFYCNSNRRFAVFQSCYHTIFIYRNNFFIR